MMEEKINQLKRQILELGKRCEELSNQLGAFKQEKQKEKQDSPHTPLQEKEKIKEKNNHNNSKIGSEKNSKNCFKKGRKRAFVPPTLDEVQAYMDEIGESRFTAVRFWNYYEAKGWVLGKSKMRFWKCVLDNWVRTENDKRREKTNTPAPQQNVVTFIPFKHVDTTGTVSYEEYLRMKKRVHSPSPPKGRK